MIKAKHQNILFFICTLSLFACQRQTKTSTEIKSNSDIKDSVALITNRTIFLIDHCENALFSAVLEEDKTKGNDSCIVRIDSRDKKINKIEILNVPANKSSINYCGNDFVVIGFGCGGPCYSQIFVFTDNRESKQFGYSQAVSNNPNIIAHLKDEKFNRIYIYNLITDEEVSLDISDNNAMLNYGHMDTLYIKDNKLFMEYQANNKQTKKKSISIEKIMK